MAWPGDEQAVAAEGRGHLRASLADRDHMVDVLKAAFVQGRLTKDEFDARIDQTLASRTYAELAMVTAGLPARPAPAQPVPRPPRRVSNAVRWGASGFITPAIVAAALAAGSQPGGGGVAAVAFIVAFVYFVFWLSAGADMLWQWCSMALPGARMCVRCAHNVTSHHAPTSCTVGRGSPRLWSRCTCGGYVPPGLSPEAADRRVGAAQ